MNFLTPLTDFLKANKLLVAVVATILILYVGFNQHQPFPIARYSTEGSRGVMSVMPMPGNVPPVFNGERKVMEDVNTSLLVKDVEQTIKDVEAETTRVQGFVISSNVYKPYEDSTGYISLRVPTAAKTEMLDFLASKSVRVISKSENGTDVTDQYVDIEARLATLMTTKTIYEGILAKANDVDEIIRVQEAILNIQAQIDAYVGQRKYLEGSTDSVLITANLSTDELALPYSPEEPWRPEVIFKLAVRSLVTTAREFGSALIWIVVYSVIWIPAAAVIVILKKRMHAKPVVKK